MANYEDVLERLLKMHKKQSESFDILREMVSLNSASIQLLSDKTGSIQDMADSLSRQIAALGEMIEVVNKRVDSVNTRIDNLLGRSRT